MKILLVNHFPLEGSGSGVYTKNLAKALARKGHDVKVIFPEHYDVQCEDFQSRVILFSNLANTKYDLDFNFPCFTSHPRSTTTYYELTGHQIDSYVDAFIRVTEEEVKNFQPDIIHAQHLWITPYVASKMGVPYVVTAHGTDLKGFVKDDRYHKYALEGGKKANKVITISKQVDMETEELYAIEEERRVLILNGYDNELFRILDLDRYEVLKDFGVEKEPKHIVVFAGKLTHFKGVDVLLKAAKHYEMELDKDVVTLIAGNGELYNELTCLAKDLGLCNVHFLGHVDQERLVELYNIADVSVVPSRTEPFGLVAIEALACATPVVGTNQGGLPDFIDDKVGTLVAVDDDLELSDAIIKELQMANKSERNQYCAEYAVENFSIQKSVDQVEALYQSILKR